MANNNQSEQARIEEEILKFWNEEDIFNKSLKQREGSELFSFYDGPPFANGLPHFGHSLVNSIKDSVLRYKTMRGYYVPRRNGWDCHGLPVEYSIEKELGISGKKEIESLGIDKFNTACQQSIFKHKDEWEVLLKRLGRWSEYDNYYATVDSTYTESVWWALAQINKHGLLYRGYKSTAYCPRCETPLSNFEVSDGYKDNVSDPSLFVKFKLEDEEAYLLGWTTTPWSLPGNAAIAINPNSQYLYVEIKETGKESNEKLVLAKTRLEVLGSKDYHVLREVKGKDLIGKRYQPLFNLANINQFEGEANLFKIWGANFVSLEDGTGVVHVAPAFGDDDLNLAKENAIPVLPTIDRSGRIERDLGLGEIEGMFFKDSDRHIISLLSARNLVYAAESIEHTYPFCWRCDTPLLYYAISSWFINVSSIRDKLIKTAENIGWIPDNIKSGRFGQWLQGAKDWAISRNRYWGAPMPIWVNQEDPNDYLVIESFDQLRDLTNDSNLNLSDVHRPYIDKIVIKKQGKTYKRIEEVLDCWFESGCMSIGQLHYPFDNKSQFKKTFPADFIVEGLDQTRLWFYVQHVVATIIFDSPAFKNVVATGMIMAADGQKLSKRLKNYPPIEEVFNNEGADTLRLFLLSNTQTTQTADYMRFNRDAMADLNRNIIATILNSYKFFKMYSDIDNFQPLSNINQYPKTDNLLDLWLMSRLDQTINLATGSADEYKLAHAIQPIFSLVDDLSNWYIRRSRRRFWKTEDDTDKQQAYQTLWFVMIKICQLLAPWAPFISDYVWRNLTHDTSLPQSVHLTHWPEANKSDDKLLDDMQLVRTIINEGLSQRAAAGIKVRQPLKTVAINAGPNDGFNKKKDKTAYLNIIRDELNVKEVQYNLKNSGELEIKLETKISSQLKREGLMRELVRNIQNTRKKAGLAVDDRIYLQVSTSDKQIKGAVDDHKETIQTETLAVTIKPEIEDGFSREVQIDGKTVLVVLKKA